MLPMKLILGFDSRHDKGLIFHEHYPDKPMSNELQPCND